MSSYSNNSNTNTNSNASNKNNLHIKLAPLPCKFSSLSLYLHLWLSLSLCISLCILTFSFHILARHDGAPLSRRRVRNMFACGAFTLIWLNFEHFHVKVAPLALALRADSLLDGYGWSVVVWNRLGCSHSPASRIPAAQRIAAKSPPMPPPRSAVVCLHFSLSMYVYVYLCVCACVLNSIFYLCLFFAYHFLLYFIINSCLNFCPLPQQQPFATNVVAPAASDASSSSLVAAASTIFCAICSQLGPRLWVWLLHCCSFPLCSPHIVMATILGFFGYMHWFSLALSLSLFISLSVFHCFL